MAKKSNTLFGTSRSAVTKNIISAESVVYGAPGSGNQVKFAYGAIKSAGSSDKSNVEGQINLSHSPDGYGAIFVGHDLVSSKILDISVGEAVNGLSEVTVKFVDMTADDGVSTLVFNAEAGAIDLLRTELIGTAVDESTVKTIEGTRKYAESLVSGGLSWIMLN